MANGAELVRDEEKRNMQLEKELVEVRRDLAQKEDLKHAAWLLRQHGGESNTLLIRTDPKDAPILDIIEGIRTEVRKNRVDEMVKQRDANRQDPAAEMPNLEEIEQQ